MRITLKAIHKHYRNVRANDGINMEIAEGSIYGILGENGAGKSTLIKILAGVYTDHAGQILLNSKPVRFASINEAAAAGISVIHQELSLVPTMTVAENIFLGLLKAYLRQGAVICGEPYWDAGFGVADVFVLLQSDQISNRYVKHFIDRI